MVGRVSEGQRNSYSMYGGLNSEGLASLESFRRKMICGVLEGVRGTITMEMEAKYAPCTNTNPEPRLKICLFQFEISVLVGRHQIPAILIGP